MPRRLTGNSRSRFSIAKFLFKDFVSELRNFKKMEEYGIYGKLRSCIPASTIPDWMVMFTGKDPGKLGIYGFHHRSGHI